MARQTDRFVIDPLHQAAITGNHPGFVVDQIIAEHRVQMPFGDCHAHGCREALTERSGCRFHAVQLEIFRMAGAG